MAKKTSHKYRAVNMLEAAGWLVADVETHLRHSFTTVDLFGFADLLCVRDGETLAVQVTSPSNVAARVEKLLAEPNVARCLMAGWLIEVIGVRDKPARDGSTVLARSIEFNKAGDRVIAFDGSMILKF
jgi:hypothetical protein